MLAVTVVKVKTGMAVLYLHRRSSIEVSLVQPFWIKATWTQEEAPESSLVSEQDTREKESTSQAMVVNGKGDPPKSRRL